MMIEHAAVGTAIAFAVGHVLASPDHTVPFVAMALARRWSLQKTIAVVLACGIAHVGGGWLLARLFFAASGSLSAWEHLLSQQARWASSALMMLGVLAIVWGLRRAARPPFDFQTDPRRDGWGWALFAVFVLGPCEPLIPLLALARASGQPEMVGPLFAVFATATLVTMAGAVFVGVKGLRALPRLSLGRTADVAAGVVLFLTGLAVGTMDL